MELFHPTAPEHFHMRNQLLQRCLRPQPLPFPIEQEYPIVLASDGSYFSYCLKQDERVCCHVNLWPRVAVDASGRELFRLGLVGNVATDPALQGKGYMRRLLGSLEELAVRQGLVALVLWSDQSEFYHKLGFTSLGSELHFHFVPSPYASELRLMEWTTKHLPDSVLERCLALRPSVPIGLQRHITEFRRLLQIPCLNLFVALQGEDIRAFAFMGKGFDMMDVIHEWGADSCQDLLALIHFAGQQYDIQRVMLLAPGSLNLAWQKQLSRAALAWETVPMAWAKALGPFRGETLEKLFVWGLDSI